MVRNLNWLNVYWGLIKNMPMKELKDGLIPNILEGSYCGMVLLYAYEFYLSITLFCLGSFSLYFTLNKLSQTEEEIQISKSIARQVFRCSCADP